jgi:hypothetical protein
MFREAAQAYADAGNAADAERCRRAVAASSSAGA